MIPAIGYMIGFYIITRMALVFEQEVSGISRGLAGFTIAVTLLCLLVLLTSEFSASQALQGF